MTTVPLQRWTRDDWVIPCTVLDPANQPINLTGATIGAELWLAGYRVLQQLSVANGGIVRVADAAGEFRVIVSRLLTARAIPDSNIADPEDRTRVLVYRIDTTGHRQTLGVVPFTVFDGSEARSIDDAGDLIFVSQSATFQLVVAASQGDPGPSNIPAAQISDSGAIGRQVVQAGDAATVRALLQLSSFSRRAVSDVNYAAQVADTYVAYAALTAPRTVTLPLASSYPPGQPLWVADETGNCSTDAPIIVAGAGGDTIAGQPNVSMASPYQKLALHSNGTDLWTV